MARRSWRPWLDPDAARRGPDPTLRHVGIIIAILDVLIGFAVLVNIADAPQEFAGLRELMGVIEFAGVNVALLTMWILVRDWPSDRRRRAKDEHALATWAKRCAYCRELVQQSAVVCPCCGYDISPQSLKAAYAARDKRIAAEIAAEMATERDR